MTYTLDLGLPAADTVGGDDNITDWCLEKFQAVYGSEVTKDGVWEYLYGVMHAPDWRKRYRHDLARNLARIPLAEDFEAFRSAGRALMDLHIGYETVEEWPVRCLVDGEADEGQADDEAYRIDAKMTRGTHSDGSKNRSVLLFNSRCPARRHSSRGARLRHIGPLPVAVGHRQPPPQESQGFGDRRRPKQMGCLGRRAVQPYPAPAQARARPRLGRDSADRGQPAPPRCRTPTPPARSTVDSSDRPVADPGGSFAAIDFRDRHERAQLGLRCRRSRLRGKARPPKSSDS